jgi:hypothetical protein
VFPIVDYFRMHMRLLLILKRKGRSTTWANIWQRASTRRKGTKLRGDWQVVLHLFADLVAVTDLIVSVPRE